MNPLATFKGVTILTFLIVFIAPDLFGQHFGRNKVQYEKFDFKEFNTDHFRILFYEDKQPFIPDIGRMAERWYQRISEVTNHEFAEEDRKPLIFYADDADFRQTNIVPGFIPGGVRGLAEPLRERVVMPIQPNHNITHHVLGHELVHSFQFDIARRMEINMNELPLWLVEGMAEYFSLGRRHTQTSMWMRDAVLNDNLPDFEDFAIQQRYNPYRYGHAFLAFIGGIFGDETITPFFLKAGEIGPIAAVDSVFNVSSGRMIEDWHAYMSEYYEPQLENRTHPDEVGEKFLAQELGHGRVNLAPSLSPDGNYVSYLRDRIPFGIDFIVADAETGDEITNLGGVDEDPHLDDIRFLTSAGSWDPDNRRVAFITFARGNNEISIWNVHDDRIERNIRVRGAPALENPAWSPDGSTIAVSGSIGGRSNIYLYNLETDETTQLTDDIFSSMEPQWSSDGETIVYVTDGGPGGTDFDKLDIRPNRLGLIDVQTGEISYLTPFGEATYSNPHFSADDTSLFFISDQDGILNIYRYNLETEQVYRITNVMTGITGITEQSPALTVSRDTGDLMFSIFSQDQYNIHRLQADDIAEELIEEPLANRDAQERVLPPYAALDENIIAGYLADFEKGLLPSDTEFDIEDHQRSLGLTRIIPGHIGVGVTPGFGAQVAGGIGFWWSDLLGDNNLILVVESRGRIQDIGGQLSYINRRGRLNYGGLISRVPQVFTRSRIVQEEGERVLDRFIQRIIIHQAAFITEFPLSETRRFEATAGVNWYVFDYELERFFLGTGRFTREDIEDPDNLFLATPSLAYVVDYSLPGFTSPIFGGRERYQVTPLIGSVNFVQAMADFRRYYFLDPVTIAFRALHRGNYYADIDDPFSTEYIGFPNSMNFVRGYSFFDFRSEECAANQDNCPVIDRLVGTHSALASAELRIPLLGTPQFGLFTFRYLPTELSLFADAGLAWHEDEPPVFKFERRSQERIPVFSAGVSTRFNLFGALILEVYYAYPFQRPDRGGNFGMQFIPGW